MTAQAENNLLEDVFRAYYDARRNKRNTVNQLQFEMDLESNLVELAAQIRDRTYKVGRSVCFIVDKPVKREIFAADFRDRVVHHLIYNYISPFFEKQLIADCYSCRKGYGTSAGIDRLEHHIRSVTRNYTRTAYVLKLDIQGYFMSMDRSLLYDMVEGMLTSRKNRKDPRVELELYLLKEIIFNDPTVNCKIKGDRNDWIGLPRSKSLFFTPENCGLPIGNLTSQLFSNIYLSGFDNYVKRELGIKHYGRYVDDFFLLHESKEFLLETLDKLKVYLKENYRLTIHPRKIYLQDLRKGVSFLGCHLKPYRRYILKRTLSDARSGIAAGDRAIGAVKEMDPARLSVFRSSYNSYMGYMKQYRTFNYRRELWKANTNYHKYFYIDPDFTGIKPRGKYRMMALRGENLPPYITGEELGVFPGELL